MTSLITQLILCTFVQSLIIKIVRYIKNSIRNCRVSSLGLMNTSTSHLDLPYPAGLVELQTLEISLSKIHDVVKSLVQLLIIRNSYNGALSCSYHSARAAYMEYLDL